MCWIGFNSKRLLFSLHVNTKKITTLSLPHRHNLNQLKDAYTKLFEDYNQVKEEKKKTEVCLCCALNDNNKRSKETSRRLAVIADR